jgi:chemotaxis protein methyltransferase CheR
VSAVEAPVITPADFEKFREFFRERTGINFTEQKRYFVDRRILSCIRAAGENSFTSWFSSVRRGAEPDLMQSLINELTVNETYFLREDYQFDCLLNSVLPRIMGSAERRAKPGDPLRILSLPCSTGEEPYSIALRLLNEWKDIDSVDVSIHAADIDSTVLASAQEGRYGKRSLQRVPPTWMKEFFDPAGPDHHQIIADIRDAIDFALLNICDPGFPAAMPIFDVIFCRNLLIYFDEHSARQATENLYAALRPGGYLFLGHSESMSRISGIFTPRRFPEGLVYQRPSKGEPT